jgi:hypothetical protein
MRLQRVYAVDVYLQEFPRGRPFGEVDETPVVVRLSAAGAQVQPAEAKLNPGEPGAHTTFFLTPLAKGVLRRARVEVLQGGRLLHEVPLPLKGTTQALTWFLACLTVLVPLGLMLACEYTPLKKQIEIPAKPPPPAQGGGGPMAGMAGGMAGGMRPTTGADVFQAMGTSTAGMLGSPDGAAPLLAASLLYPRSVGLETATQSRRMPSVEYRPGMPGEVLTLYITQNVHPIPKVTEPAARRLGEVYQTTCNLTTDDHLAFWTALVLLGFTVISWVVHLPLPASRQSKPLTLARAPGEGFSAKTLPLGGSEPPVVVEPARD